MVKLFTSSFALFICFILNTSGQITFQKVYSDSGNYNASQIRQTTDGGYIIVGSATKVAFGETDVLLIKTDLNGDTLWTKQFGGVFDDRGNDIFQTSDGGYIVVGFTLSFGVTNHDIYLIKTTANGNLSWSRTIGTAGLDMGMSVKQTLDGGYIISGILDSGSGTVMFLMKTNPLGDVLWQQYLQGLNESEVQQTSDGGFIFSGMYNSDINFVRVDSLGNLMWLKTYGGNLDDRGASVQQTTDGGFILCGFIYDAQIYGHQVYVIKTDSNGDTLWTRSFGGPGHYLGYSIQQTTDGGYIIAGSVQTGLMNTPDVYLLKTDSLGIPVWSKAIGDSMADAGYSVRQTTDNGYVIGGVYAEPFISTYAYIIKTDLFGSSGCNETLIPVSLLSYSTQVTTNGNVITPITLTTSNPPTITTSGCTENTLCTTVGLQPEISEDVVSINISPNPSPGNFIISFDKEIPKAYIEIFNSTGATAFLTTLTHLSSAEINLENASPGIYVIKVVEGETCFYRKFIVTGN